MPSPSLDVIAKFNREDVEVLPYRNIRDTATPRVVGRRSRVVGSRHTYRICLPITASDDEFEPSEE